MGARGGACVAAVRHRLATSARLRGAHAQTRVAFHSMASDMLCCPGGASRLDFDRTAGSGPGAAAPAESSVRAARASARYDAPREWVAVGPPPACGSEPGDELEERS